MEGEKAKKGSVLFSGICTTNNFLHSFGLLICAGTKGYCCKENEWSIFRNAGRRMREEDRM